MNAKLPHNLTPLFDRLARSRFRSRFRLGPKERSYLNRNGMPVIRQHAQKFISDRLAPAQPPNDGRQTPMRGHPVFIAQHATATCCRSCLAKWHHIAKGTALTDAQIVYVLSVIEHWLTLHDHRRHVVSLWDAVSESGDLGE